jgi:hypothetical protein
MGAVILRPPTADEQFMRPFASETPMLCKHDGIIPRRTVAWPHGSVQVSYVWLLAAWLCRFLAWAKLAARSVAWRGCSKAPTAAGIDDRYETPILHRLFEKIQNAIHGVEIFADSRNRGTGRCSKAPLPCLRLRKSLIVDVL